MFEQEKTPNWAVRKNELGLTIVDARKIIDAIIENQNQLSDWEIAKGLNPPRKPTNRVKWLRPGVLYYVDRQNIERWWEIWKT